MSDNTIGRRLTGDITGGMEETRSLTCRVALPGNKYRLCRPVRCGQSLPRDMKPGLHRSRLVMGRRDGLFLVLPACMPLTLIQVIYTDS